MLTQDQLKEVLHYSPETGVFTWLIGRCKNGRAGSAHVADSGKTYRKIRLSGRWYREHRLAFLYITGSFPATGIDHENGNGSDNRWTNLRPVTCGENQKNMRRYTTNTSGVSGVSWVKALQRWYAYVSVNNKNKHLGHFTNKEDAIAARKAAEIELGFHPNHGTERPL